MAFKENKYKNQNRPVGDYIGGCVGKMVQGLIKQYSKDESASTAVEFAIVSVPFIMLLLSVIEISLMFAASSMLQSTTQQAARLIRTGQIQQSGADPEQAFHDALCENGSYFVDCDLVQYEVISMDGGFTDFSNYEPQFDVDGNLQSQGFTPGGVNDVVLVRTVYRYPLLTPLLGPVFSDGPDNTRLLISTVVMENEPYDIQEVVDEL